MLNYLVFILALYAALHQKITAIFDRNYSCNSHVDCSRLFSVHSVGYCCRDYSTNSGRSWRINISSCLDRFCISDQECVSVDECCSGSKNVQNILFAIIILIVGLINTAVCTDVVPVV